MVNFLRRTIACVIGMAAALPACAAGIVLLDFGGNSQDLLRELRIGADGRILADVATATSTSSDCGIYGLDANGSLLATFGTAGRFLPGTCVADLQVLATGSLTLVEGNRVRVRDATGALVSTSVDLYQLPPVSNKHRFPSALAVQADGKPIVGGSGRESTSGLTTWNLARVNLDGSVDTTFGGGLVMRDVGGTSDQAVAEVHPLPGGKILVSGTNSGPGATGTALVRFNADGSVDSTFAANGQLNLPPGPGRIAFDSTQRIYVPTWDGTVARLSADGTLDGTYAGSVTGTGLVVTGIAVDGTNRAVLFGRLGAAATATGFVARLDTAGVPDATFNGTGQASIDFGRGAPISSGTDVRCLGALQTGSLPVIACTVVSESDPQESSKTDLAVARLQANGQLDATFGSAQQNSDTYPDAFSFMPATVPYGTVNVVSNAVTIAGINASTSVDIEGSASGGYSVGCNGSFSTSSGTISPGATLCVRQNALAQPGAVSQVKLLVGGRAAVFTVTSSNTPADSAPDAFTFADPASVATSTLIASNTITISGITGFATVTVTNGSYSIGCTAQSFGTGTETVTNGATICVRHTTAATASTATSTTLTVGGVSDTFTTTTAAAAPVTAPVTPPVTAPASGGGGGALDELALALLAAFAVARVLTRARPKGCH